MFLERGIPFENVPDRRRCARCFFRVRANDCRSFFPRTSSDDDRIFSHRPTRPPPPPMMSPSIGSETVFAVYKVSFPPPLPDGFPRTRSRFLGNPFMRKPCTARLVALPPRTAHGSTVKFTTYRRLLFHVHSIT